MIDASEIVLSFKKHIVLGEEVSGSKMWESLIETIDKRFPDFKKSIDKVYGDIPIKYLKFLYLLKAGLNKSEASTLLGVTRSTTNYWCKGMNKNANGLSVEYFIKDTFSMVVS